MTGSQRAGYEDGNRRVGDGRRGSGEEKEGNQERIHDLGEGFYQWHCSET